MSDTCEKPTIFNNYESPIAHEKPICCPDCKEAISTMNHPSGILVLTQFFRCPCCDTLIFDDGEPVPPDFMEKYREAERKLYAELCMTSLT